MPHSTWVIVVIIIILILILGFFIYALYRYFTVKTGEDKPTGLLIGGIVTFIIGLGAGILLWIYGPRTAETYLPRGSGHNAIATCAAIAGIEGGDKGACLNDCISMATRGRSLLEIPRNEYNQIAQRCGAQSYDPDIVSLARSLAQRS